MDRSNHRTPPPQPLESDHRVDTSVAALLEDPIVAPARPPAGAGPVVAMCVGVDPHRPGALEVEWSTPDGHRRSWAVALVGVDARPGDRVLALEVGTRGAGEAEMMLVGVVDGLTHGQRPPAREAGTLQLGRGEHLTVVDSAGRQLLQIVDGATGPVVRLSRGDVAVEVEGELRIAAHAIRLEATDGPVEIEAAHDIRLEGETISLN